MIDLSIIIVSYNTKEFLKKCLQSIAEDTNGLKVEIIIVDNASTDGSADAIGNFQFSILQQVQDKFFNFQLIRNKENMGFSKANNQGVKKANGRYLLFLNPDTIICKNTLDKMFKFMEEHKDAGAATCRVQLLNKKLDDACHRGFPTPWRAFCYFSGLSQIFPTYRIFAGYTLGWEDLSKVHEVDSCSGAFMMVRREAGEEVGWWDEDYFWYGEDLDLCYRLKEKSPSTSSGQGWKIYFVPSVSILHYKGVSGGIKEISNHLTTASKETKIKATKARFEAMRIFYKKHYLGTYPKIITWLVLQGINLKERLMV